MALTSDEQGTGLEQLRRLASDEEASAAVEFIVLIPVYILLMAGLFMFTNLALIRQSLVQASRFQAWSPQEPESYGNFADTAFFGPYDGNFGVRTRTKTNVSVATGQVSASDFTGGTQAARELAAHVFNEAGQNAGENALYRSEAQSDYTYSGLVVFGMTTIKQSTQSSVLLTRNVKRKEYQGGQQGHPMMDWSTGSGPAKSVYFDPTQTQNMPLNPIYNGGKTEFTETGPGNPGIWKRRARIGGNDQSENDYYFNKPKG